VKYLKNYIPATLLFVVLFLVKQSSYQHLLHPQIWYIFIFFAFIDILVVKIAEKGFEQDNFINFYLAATVIRMVLVLIFMGVFMYIYPDNRKVFVITSFAFYLFFTIFEISVLLRNLRRF
jgi:hypothetical protein